METSVDPNQTLGNRLHTDPAELHVQEQLSGAVMVTRHDEVLLTQGYGHADLEYGVVNTPQTRFRIGSITNSLRQWAPWFFRSRVNYM